MMKGYIRQKYKVNISQRRISTALQMVAPQYYQCCQTITAKLTNPIPYKADFFGYKLHKDQNKKLVMYSVTHVTVIDGHLRFILCGVTILAKNNQIIYEKGIQVYFSHPL